MQRHKNFIYINALLASLKRVYHALNQHRLFLNMFSVTCTLRQWQTQKKYLSKWRRWKTIQTHSINIFDESKIFNYRQDSNMQRNRWPPLPNLWWKAYPLPRIMPICLGKRYSQSIYGAWQKRKVWKCSFMHERGHGKSKKS